MMSTARAPSGAPSSTGSPIEGAACAMVGMIHQLTSQNPIAPAPQPKRSARRGVMPRAAHTMGARATQPGTKPQGRDTASHHKIAVAITHSKRTCHLEMLGALACGPFCDPFCDLFRAASALGAGEGCARREGLLA